MFIGMAMLNLVKVWEGCGRITENVCPPKTASYNLKTVCQWCGATATIVLTVYVPPSPLESNPKNNHRGWKFKRSTFAVLCVICNHSCGFPYLWCVALFSPLLFFVTDCGVRT